MSSLWAASPWAAAIATVIFGMLRLIARHDQAFSRLLFSVVAVIGTGARSRQALALLRLYVENPAASGTSFGEDTSPNEVDDREK